MEKETKKGRLFELVEMLLPPSSADEDVTMAEADDDEDEDEVEEHLGHAFVRTVNRGYVKLLRASALHVSRTSSYNMLMGKAVAAINRADDDDGKESLARLLQVWYGRILSEATDTRAFPLRPATAFARFMPLFQETAVACGALTARQAAAVVADDRLRDMSLVLFMTAVVPVCAHADRLAAYVHAGVNAAYTTGHVMSIQRNVDHFVRVHMIPTLHALALVCDMIATWAAAAVSATCAACYRTLLDTTLAMIEKLGSDSYKELLVAAALHRMPTLPPASRVAMLLATQVPTAAATAAAAARLLPPTAADLAARRPPFRVVEPDTEVADEEEQEEAEEEEEEGGERPSKRQRLEEIHARLQQLLVNL